MHFLQDILIILSVSLIAGSIFAYFNQSPIIGYLLGGVFLKSLGDSFITENSKHYLEGISELGVCLLLFSIGLEFSWNKLKSFGTKSLLIGFSQILLSTFVFAILFNYFGSSLKESIIIGFMLSLSSTACVLRILIDRGEIDSEYGRNSLIILLAQDIAVIPISILIILVSGGQGDGGLVNEITKISTALIGILVLLYLVVDKVALKILPKLTLNQNKELTVLLAVVLGIGSAWLAHMLKISPALGAFVTGMFLASSKFSHQITSNVPGFKIVLISLFFSSAGMRADLDWIGNNLVLVVFATLILIILKTIIVALVLRIFKQGLGVGLSSGIALSQIGEFAFVLGDMAFKLETLSEENYQLIISVAICSMFLTPFLIKQIPLIRRYADKRFSMGVNNYNNPDNANKSSSDICVVGFGPSEKEVATQLLNITKEICIIDLNVNALEEAREIGFSTILGDARQIEMLEHAGISKVKIFVITIPDFDSASVILKNIKQINHNIFTVVRSRYDKNMSNFFDLGANEVIAEEAAAGEQIVKVIMKQDLSFLN